MEDNDGLSKELKDYMSDDGYKGGYAIVGESQSADDLVVLLRNNGYEVFDQILSIGNESRVFFRKKKAD